MLSLKIAAARTASRRASTESEGTESGGPAPARSVSAATAPRRCPVGALCRSDGCGEHPAFTRRRALERGGRLRLDSERRPLWVVRSGLAGVCTVFEDGRRQIVRLLGAGDIVCPFGAVCSEMWLEALSECELCEFDAQEARRGDEGAFMLEMFRLSHQELRRAVDQIVLLGRLDAMERICLFLADMARRFGSRGPDGVRLHLPLKREDIADHLGMNAETVSRLLTRLKRDGLIKLTSRSDYVLPDVAALERRAPIAPTVRETWGDCAP